MIDVLREAMGRSHDRKYADRAWLAAELPPMITRGEWATLGGLLVHAALAAAPVARLAERLEAERVAPPLSAGAPARGDASWAAVELGLHLAAVLNPAGDLQAAALRAAGAVFALELG